MEEGLLYVIFNEWIRNPETQEMPYKIGITKYSVSHRYYGLGLKMPGKFETKFAYKLKNYTDAKKALGIIFSEHNINGEWYDLSEDDLTLIELNCKKMQGELITDEIEKEINKETELLIEPQHTQDVAVDIEKVFDNKIIDILTVNKNIYFGTTTVDVLNRLFGKNYKPGFAAYGKSVFMDKEEDRYIWFSPLDQLKKNWTNIMPDEMHIHQIWKGSTPRSAAPVPKTDIAIFVKKPFEEFRFAGIFHVENDDGTIIIYKRISSELHPEEWNI